MRAYPLLLVAVTLLAGSAGYISHRVLATAEPSPSVELGAGTPASVPAPSSSPSPDSPLAWTFLTPDGVAKRLDSWPGQPVVLNFWATWCPPCLREIPAFVALQARYKERGLQFIGIALDEAAAVAPFVAENGLNYPVLLGNDDVVLLMQELGNVIGGLPYTVVLSDGKVVLTHQGEWAAADAEAALLEFMKTP